ncbi:condensation domain-containing protein [Streptomyces echinatus]|uniref:condensation domain-containing protein n=1 Tax=Streptomyces echinatus TaxID=67293 RepID=UPI0031E92B99
MASFRGGSVPVGLSTELRAAVEKLAQTNGVTTSIVLQAALVVLLHRLGGGKDVTVGSPIAGRTEEALNELVGFFVNTWTLRVQVTADRPFEWVLEQVRKKALAAYDHQDVPFERLVELLRPERSTRASPPVPGRAGVAEQHPAAPGPAGPHRDHGTAAHRQREVRPLLQPGAGRVHRLRRR